MNGNELLTEIEATWPKLGAYLRNYINPSIDTLAQNAAVSPKGNLQAPAPPESINVKVSGEYAQVVVNHSAPIQKGIQYITHFATNPQLSGAIIHDHGCSRCPPHVFLPTKDASGNTHQWYAATVAQYPGSPPSVTYYGGSTPQPFTMTGATEADILPGTGSGTASNGGQALVGLGKVQIRSSVTPKRNVG